MKSILSGVGLLALCLIQYTPSFAQMPHDAIYMPKKSVCIAGMYGKSTWTEYWEGSLKRENFNIGTHTTQTVSLMPAIGLTNRVNLILNLPYVSTSTSAGNLLGQKGIQDLSGWLKVKVASYEGLSLHGVAGASIPLTKYVPDFLPMSIGLGARTVSGRLIANYTHPETGLYLNMHGSLIWRSNIKVDRDSYQADGRVYNSHEVKVPHGSDAAVRIGVLRKTWQLEAFGERMANLSGDNIRRNDMPFPTNNMQATTVGFYGKFQPKNIGVNARYGKVIDGLNMGLSTSYSVGILYQIGGF